MRRNPALAWVTTPFGGSIIVLVASKLVVLVPFWTSMVVVTLTVAVATILATVVVVVYVHLAKLIASYYMQSISRSFQTLEVSAVVPAWESM